MDGSLSAVKGWEWVLAGVMGVVLLVITLLFTAPFWDEWKRSKDKQEPPEE